MVELIIAEKPSAARKIADALSDGPASRQAEKGASYYVVSHGGEQILVASAVGHVYSLSEKVKSKGFKYPVFDIEWKPSYTIEKGAAYQKPYIDILVKLAKKAKKFTIACDYDTEGSVIGLNALRYACKQKDASRMKFSTMMAKDLVAAYKAKAKHLDWGQALAGETRHYLDWYYGINLSRALTSAIKAAGAFKVLSTGRVQGPALKIVVDRELEIQAFKPVAYWEISLDGRVSRKKLVAMHDEGKFWDGSKAKQVHERCAKESKAKCVGKNAKKFTQKAPHPFDLTSLQTEAYRLFKIKPKQTLQIAQSLYLASVISYPRTSSQQYPESIEYANLMTQLARQPKYAPLVAKFDLKKLKPNNGKKTDPAHPAIYPTGLVPDALEPREAKVYDLIVKRFLSTFAPNATRETLKIAIELAGEPFTAKGTRTTERGWHEFYDPYVKLEEEELPKVETGDTIEVVNVALDAKETQPPKRYTPASLVKALERENLGTKATRSEIVETLYKRNYIIEESIQATKFGIEIAKVLEVHVPKIVDPELTRTFETNMEAVREDKKEPEQILDHAKDVLVGILTDFKKKEKTVGEELLKTLKQTRHDVAVIGKCPQCEPGELVIKKGKFGRFAACDKYPDCKITIALPKTGKITSLDKSCEACSWPMIKVGSKGRFQEVCLNKDCKTKAPEVEVEAQKCDKCGNGNMVVRKSLYGSFLACDQYPKCKNAKPIQGASPVKYTNNLTRGTDTASTSTAPAKTSSTAAAQKKSTTTSAKKSATQSTQKSAKKPSKKSVAKKSVSNKTAKKSSKK